MRIRTVKPLFLRHERLQDLETENPGQHVMLVFMGLWMLADSKGRFEYKPRSMKLDILPFLDYSMQKTLDLLESNLFIKTYEVAGQKYGLIPSFNAHQRLSGKELTDGEKYPLQEQQGSDGEIDQELNQYGEAVEKHPVPQEGKGKGEVGKRKEEEVIPTHQVTPPIGNSSVYSSMEEVEQVCLNQSTAWQQSMMRKFNIKETEIIKKWIAEFFETMRAAGQDKRDLRDSRHHCFSWMNIQLQKEKKSGKKEKIDTILHDHAQLSDYWAERKEYSDT